MVDPVIIDFMENYNVVVIIIIDVVVAAHANENFLVVVNTIKVIGIKLMLANFVPYFHIKTNYEEACSVKLIDGT